MLDTYRASLETDKPDMSESERRMAELAMTARGAQMVIVAERHR